MKRKAVWALLVVLASTAIFAPAPARAQTGAADSKRACLLEHEVRCLILELSGKEQGPARAEAASDLVAALTTADPPLDAQTALRAREAVLKALRDRSVDVRVATVTAVEQFGDESMIPALQAVATSDPILSLRTYTALAISRMTKRLAAHSGR